RYSADPQQLPRARQIIQAVNRIFGHGVMLLLVEAVTRELEKPQADTAALLRIQPGNTRMAGPFPHTVAPVSVAGRRALEISDAFVRGVREGFAKAVTVEDLARLDDKLKQAAAVNALSGNTLVSAGMIYGITKDVVETIKGLVELLGLIPKLPELLGHLQDLLVALIEDDAIAVMLGTEVGAAVGKKLVEASHYSAPRMAFYIGELTGPLVIWAILSLVGVTEIAGAA